MEHADKIDLTRIPLVREVMTASPRTIAPDARLSEATALMEELAIQHLPVIDGEGKLVGLLSERHLRDAMPSILMLKDPEERRRSLKVTRVEQVCIKEPGAIDAGRPITEAIRQMRRLRAGSLPVLEHHKLVGILTSGDLITLLEKMLRSISMGS